MARIFITGSADGLGRAAAETLLSAGHEVIVHARSNDRLVAVGDLVERGASSVVGDLADLSHTRGVADQVNELGRLDAVIHNAGVERIVRSARQRHRAVPAHGSLSPPPRLVYLSSGMHRGRRADVAGSTGPDTLRSYSDSKLFVTALAGRPPLARRVQQCGRSRLGATRMGGGGLPTTYGSAT